jgi:hypothetical protein
MTAAHDVDKARLVAQHPASSSASGPARADPLRSSAGAVTHLVHDDEADDPFDLIREIVTITGWVAATVALLLPAWAALD